MTPLSSRDELLKQVILRAVTSPVSLFLGTTGVLLVTTPSAWPVGLAVLAAEAGWLYSRIRDPRAVQESNDEMLRRRWLDLMNRLEDLSAVLDRETAQALSSIVESQERLLGLYGTDAAARPGSRPSRAQVTTLLQHCLSLAEKRHRLQTYIAGFRSQDVQRQVAQLQTKAEQSTDAVTRELYQRAVDQKRQELENYVRLEDAVRRIDGQLAAVQCTFDNMLSKVVALQSAHAMTDDTSTDPVFAELNQLANGVAALESTLDETLTLRGAA